jgi:hypothetical protein
LVELIARSSFHCQIPRPGGQYFGSNYSNLYQRLNFVFFQVERKALSLAEPQLVWQRNLFHEELFWSHECEHFLEVAAFLRKNKPDMANADFFSVHLTGDHYCSSDTIVANCICSSGRKTTLPHARNHSPMQELIGKKSQPHVEIIRWGS